MTSIFTLEEMRIETARFSDNKKIYEELRLKQSELNALLQVTQAINDNLGITGLANLYCQTLNSEIGFERIAFFLQDENWKCVSKIGVSEEFNISGHKKDLLSFAHLTHLKKGKHPFAPMFDIIVPVYHKDKPLAFTLLGGLEKIKGFSIEERLNFIQTISNIISVAIENKKLFKEQLRQQEIKKELELAGKMQTTLIPEKLPSDERVEMEASYMPHFDVGGDYYDAFELNEDEIFFCIGDISGKGISAALLMASFQAGLRSLVKQQQSLKDMVQELNIKVNELTKGERFITLFMALYNSHHHTLQYINAGHPPPVLYQNNETILLEDGCTILGMFDKIPVVKLGKVNLKDEALLLNYTDGLSELEDKRKEQLGVDRLAVFVKENHSRPLLDFIGELTNYIVAFKGKKLFNDDISILLCRFPGNR